MDWRHEAGQQDHRDHEHEQVNENLLHILRDGRNGKAQACRTDHEDEEGQEQREQVAGKRHLKPEPRNEEDHRGLKQADDHRRCRLADQDLRRRERRDEQLIKCTLLALFRNREAREEHDLHKGNHREE